MLSHFAVQNPVGESTLFETASLVTPRRKHVTFTPLDEEEIPKEGDVIGLDAEFVTLNQVSSSYLINFNPSMDNWSHTQ